MYYTGIGSRETPNDILWKMVFLAAKLAKLNWILRSGGADGADSAFEFGCDKAQGKKEIYLPWKDFNKNKSPHFLIPAKAYDISAEVHPHWNYLKLPVKKLMARNAQQILGENLDTKSIFVVCWTPDGCISDETRSQKTGGTGQAISIASLCDIPVFNLQREDAEDNLMKFLNTGHNE